MRLMFLALLIFAGSVATASAQNVKDKPRSVRVAVVNVALILEKYEIAHDVKADLKEMNRKKSESKPSVLAIEIEVLEKLLRTAEMPAKAKEQLEKQLETTKKKLREWKHDRPGELSKKATDNIVEVWKDIQDAVAKYAAWHEIDLVFGYTDPLNKNELDLFPNVNRKMQAMDVGSTVPLALTAHVDISEAILDRLKWRDWDGEDNKSAKAIVGTDRVAVVNIGHVFNHFKKAIKFKNELEATLVPFKLEAKKLQDKIKVWDQTIQDRDFDEETEEQLRRRSARQKDAFRI